MKSSAGPQTSDGVPKKEVPAVNDAKAENVMWAGGQKKFPVQAGA